jgi:hypothetical protein
MLLSVLASGAVALSEAEQGKRGNMLNVKGEDMALWAQGSDNPERFVGMLGPSNAAQCTLAAKVLGWEWMGCRDNLASFMPAGCYVNGNDPPHVYFNAMPTEQTNAKGCGIYGNWCISGTPQSEPLATTCMEVKPRASGDGTADASALAFGSSAAPPLAPIADVLRPASLTRYARTSSLVAPPPRRRYSG